MSPIPCLSISVSILCFCFPDAIPMCFPPDFSFLSTVSVSGNGLAVRYTSLRTTAMNSS